MSGAKKIKMSFQLASVLMMERSADDIKEANRLEEAKDRVRWK